MARIHRVGRPETASEKKAIKTLADRLPDEYVVVHNFEVSTGRGLPYEFDIALVTPFAIWHIEVKGYRGKISGDERQWVLSNGHVTASPIPLANKKSRLLSDKLQRHSNKLREVFVDTAILLTDDNVQVHLSDDQAFRIVHLHEVLDHFTDPQYLAVSVGRSIERLRPTICDALFHCEPARRVHRIGLYDVVERLNQTEFRSVFLAKHRYIRTRPHTILKVFHVDPYASEAQRQRQTEAIFHDQDAMRQIGGHPNLVSTGDFFAWDDNKFVLPTEYIEQGKTLRHVLEEAREGGLDWAEKTDIITGMARGIQHAHRNGVTHRDIRPLNVVVAPGGVVKLVNFDLALIRGEKQIQEPKGLERRLDRRYAAPEVRRDPASATVRSDIYSLGIVFHELITGQRPYEDPKTVTGETPLDREKLLSELSAPDSADFMSSPEDAVSVIARMCAQDSEQRYTCLDGIIEDLAILRD